MKTPFYVLWPALVLGALETAFWLVLLYALMRVVLHIIAQAASPYP